MSKVENTMKRSIAENLKILGSTSIFWPHISARVKPNLWLLLFLFYVFKLITWIVFIYLFYVFSDDILRVPHPDFHSQEAGPLKKYDEMVRNGKLKLDRYQRQIVEHLQRLYSEMLDYQPSNTGFLSKVGNDWEY